MKKTRTLVGWLVVCGLALGMINNVSAGDGKERTGKVVRITGNARYSTGNNVWQPLKVGTALKAGMIVQTAKKSSVDIVLGESYVANPRPQGPTRTHMMYQPVAEQDLVQLAEDSVLAIDKLTAVETGADTVTETMLDLRQGRIMGTTKKISAASRYEVKIPSGVAGIRGTIYTLSADGVVKVLVGSVVIAYTKPDGTVVTQVVNGGYQYDAKSGAITPIPDFDQQEMVKAAKAAGIGPNVPPTSFVVDQTIYYVSPRIGFNGNSGTSGGQGDP
jgi:hypothetical protein